MKSVARLAAANNAQWCDLVCRSHAADATFDEQAWTSRTRTPPHYPDAVTLVPDPSVPDLLARIDTSEGCSIKDSFASLDLTALGFRVLFDAEWIVRAGRPLESAPPGPRWEVVDDADAFAIWEQAWRGDDGSSDVLKADLLEHDSVIVLAARVGEQVVGGAVLNRSLEVVGISNFFAIRDAAVSWAGCLALVDALLPESTLVGYGTADSLRAPRAEGFATAGPLRVWLREGWRAGRGREAIVSAAPRVGVPAPGRPAR